MSLDQCIYTNTRNEIAYFRRVNWLHGWVEDLWRSRGGKGEFNCVFCKLKEEDLRKLEQDIKQGNIKARKGYFFGDQEIYEEDKEEVLQIIKKALTEIKDGKEIEYNSWW